MCFDDASSVLFPTVVSWFNWSGTILKADNVVSSKFANRSSGHSDRYTKVSIEFIMSSQELSINMLTWFTYDFNRYHNHGLFRVSIRL